MNWTFVFYGFFSLWGIYMFLQVVGHAIRSQKLALEAAKYAQEEKARRDSFLPVASAITCEPPPDAFADAHG